VDVVVVGTSHAVAPAAVRDRVALDQDGVARALRAATVAAGIDEAVVLATCTRTEIYLSAAEPARAAPSAWRAVADAAGSDQPPCGPHTFVLTGADAVAHLFQVAAGLDSLIVGEHQVLGQVGDALALAEACGAAGPRLSRLFQAAVRTGRRARAESAIGRGPISVSLAGARLVERVRGGFDRAHVVVVGVGSTGASAARFLARRAPRRLTLCNRSVGRAETLARVLGAEGVGWEALAGVLEDADAVLTATRSPVPILTRPLLERVVDRRRGRPLLVVDLCAPRNVDPDAARLPGIDLRDLDHLGDVVERALERRVAEIPRVEEIVDDEARRFLRWYGRLEGAGRRGSARPDADETRDSGVA
jgi:glutamyl-tRNA reductase